MSKSEEITIQTIRQQITEQRKQLSSDFCSQAANQIVKSVNDSKIFLNSNKIALYMPVNGEVDLTAIIPIIHNTGKNCYLPILAATKQQLLFAQYQPGDSLTANKYGIPEPAANEKTIINPRNLDLIIVPLVGFDQHGNRIGSGAGYYDRTFAFKKQVPSKTKPYLLGIGYEMQKLAAVIARPWDVPLQGIITEENMYFSE